MDTTIVLNIYLELLNFKIYCTKTANSHLLILLNLGYTFVHSKRPLQRNGMAAIAKACKATSQTRLITFHCVWFLISI